MLLVVLKNVLCVVADGLSKNVDFFIVRKKYFHHEEKVFSPYTRHEKKPNNVLYVLVYVLIVILAVFAVFWAVKQITVNTRVASEISYKE